MSDEERLAAAHELYERLHHYVVRGFRNGLVARQLEPLLDYYVREYPPRLEHAELTLKERLASAAWQFIFNERDGVTSAELDTMIVNVGKLRREFDPTDAWPPPKEVAEIREHIRRVLHHSRVDLRPTPGRKLDETTRANQVFEILAEGHYKPDSRGGVRPERRKLLEEARDRWLDLRLAAELHDADAADAGADAQHQSGVPATTTKVTAKVE